MSVEVRKRVWDKLVAVHEWLTTYLLNKLNYGTTIGDDDMQPFLEAYQLVQQAQFQLETSVYKRSWEALEHLRIALLDFGDLVNRQIQARNAGDQRQLADLLERMNTVYNGLVKDYENRLHRVKEAIGRSAAPDAASRISFPSLEFVGGGMMIDSPNSQQENRNINIGPNASISAPITIAETIEHSFNTLADASVEDDLKQLLAQLLKAVNEVNKEVPQERSDEAEAMARDAETLIKETASSNPRRRWYEVSLEGLKQAAVNIGELAQPVLEIVGKLTPFLLG
jgi:hypothetical protein